MPVLYLVKSCNNHLLTVVQTTENLEPVLLQLARLDLTAFDEALSLPVGLDDINKSSGTIFQNCRGRHDVARTAIGGSKTKLSFDGHSRELWSEVVYESLRGGVS